MRDELFSLCPTQLNTPYLDDRPKIHKDNCPLTPIISMCDSLFPPIDKTLATILRPSSKICNSYVSNTAHAKQRLCQAWDVHGLGHLVSFDVTDLFTKVPVNEAIEVTMSLPQQDQSLSNRTEFPLSVLDKLLKFCLTLCYFSFNSRLCVLNDGVAMGSDLSCIIANLYMAHFETMAFSEALNKQITPPVFWIRFVDDVLAIYKDDE